MALLALASLPLVAARSHAIFAESPHISGGVIAGIVIGAVGGVALIIGAIFLFIWLRKRDRLSFNRRDGSNSGVPLNTEKPVINVHAPDNDNPPQQLVPPRPMMAPAANASADGDERMLWN